MIFIIKYVDSHHTIFTMQLNKEQTMRLFINNRQQKAIRKKYIFTTKFKWKCIACASDIYVSFKQYSRHSIFCDECWKQFRSKETIAQFYYLQQLKNKQIEMFDNLKIDLSKLTQE